MSTPWTRSFPCQVTKQITRKTFHESLNNQQYDAILSLWNQVRPKIFQIIQYCYDCLFLLFTDTSILLKALHEVCLPIVLLGVYVSYMIHNVLSRLVLSYLILSCSSYLILCPGNNNSDEEFGVENFLFLIWYDTAHLSYPSPSPYMHSTHIFMYDAFVCGMVWCSMVWYGEKNKCVTSTCARTPNTIV